MARLLDTAGLLTSGTTQLDCGACERMGLQERRGCGTVPVRRVGDRRTREVVEEEWDAGAWLQRCEDKGYWPPDMRAPKPGYALADVGDVIEVLGPEHAWDVCPAYYARLQPDVIADIEAARIIEWELYGERAGYTEAASPREMRLLRMAGSVIAHIRAVEAEERAEQRRAEAEERRRQKSSGGNPRRRGGW